MRTLRKPEHRRSVTFTIAISEDDLRAIARHGYEGAASADQAQRVQALNLFITDMLARRLESAKGNRVTAVATPFQ